MAQNERSCYEVPSERSALPDRDFAGRVVAARAEQGEDYLLAMLDLDPGARRLGELALHRHVVPRICWPLVRL
jgi:hypothetical protein